jgi:ATP-dependent Lon protease
MFVTTANTMNMPGPLLDRMEIIRLSGYTEDEKVEIANRHLLPKQVKAHGLKDGEWSISEGGLRDLIRYYTRESGVRNLERELANLARKAVKEIMVGKSKTIKVTAKNLDKYAGIRKYRFGEIEADDMVGVVTGLAWTEVGGELLNIEAVMVPGKGKMTITGKLGDVMQESIQAARSYVQSRAASLGILPPLFNKRDIHVHVPEGATPKDGPSAGVGMVTSIVSVLTGNPVKKDVAMTGEVTLRGRVLPIGGLKEKLLAAHRGGIKLVLIPKDNEKDLTEIPENVKKGLEIVPVTTVDEVLSKALAKPVTPVEWDEDKADLEASALTSGTGDDDDVGGVVTH